MLHTEITEEVTAVVTEVVTVTVVTLVDMETLDTVITPASVVTPVMAEADMGEVVTATITVDLEVTSLPLHPRTQTRSGGKCSY